MNIIVSILLNGLVVLLTAYLLPGVGIDSYLDAILVAIVLGIANTFIKPILTILTLPVTILTLGLFLLVINGIMVMLADAILPGFEVNGLGWAIGFSLVMALLNLLLGRMISN